MDGLIRDRIRQFTSPAERVGANYIPGEGCHIRIWAPHAKTMEISWNGQVAAPLQAEERGYYTGFFPDQKPGDRYYFHLDGKKIPDPASRYQPEGVYGPSQITAQDYPWTDENWQGVPFDEWVIYEIHPGTYSKNGDFKGIIGDLPRLKDLGITTLEIMPVSQFSGGRNWGYDGVFPHSVQNSYGGPEGLKALVNACHLHGLSVILDVVYNHIGPEGNILFSCGPYAQDKYRTPWGDALNYDGRDSEEVRRYFLQSAWQWLTEYHLDGLRLDAVQTIFDTSPISFLQELSAIKREAEEKRGMPLILIAETDMNDSRLLDPPEQNGFGFDGQWADDLHHNIHAYLTGEQGGYYQDYGALEQFYAIYKNGVAYSGNYSEFRKRRHGKSYAHIDRKKLIVETQNHDQIGNRFGGERLSMLVDFKKLKMAAACIFLSPFTPLLFMGEEYACDQPFLYFVSHEDPALLRAVREGRISEWKDFAAPGDIPDPAALSTFERCILGQKSFSGVCEQGLMIQYYKKLIEISKRLRKYRLEDVQIRKEEGIISLHYGDDTIFIIAILCFQPENIISLRGTENQWNLLFHSEDYSETHSHDNPVEMPPFSAAVITGEKSDIQPQDLHSFPFLSAAKGKSLAGRD